MSSLEAIRQDVRREAGHGSEEERLINELRHKRDRIGSGGLGARQEIKEKREFAKLADELSARLRKRGLGTLSDYVYDAKVEVAGDEGDVPSDLDFRGL